MSSDGFKPWDTSGSSQQSIAGKETKPLVVRQIKYQTQPTSPAREGLSGPAPRCPPACTAPAPSRSLTPPRDAAALTDIKGETIQSSSQGAQPESCPAPRMPACLCSPGKGCLPSLRCLSHTSAHQDISLSLPALFLQSAIHAHM